MSDSVTPSHKGRGPEPALPPRNPPLCSGDGWMLYCNALFGIQGSSQVGFNTTTCTLNTMSRSRPSQTDNQCQQVFVAMYTMKIKIRELWVLYIKLRQANFIC